jgi:hypothetical protein
MKNISLNPQFEGSIFSDFKETEEQKLTWKNIIENLSNISLVLFKFPISNKLGNSANQKVFY